MLAGVNDRVEQARELAALLDPQVFKVNLIPYNPTGMYDGSSRKAIDAFKHVLDRARIPATVRLTRGRDIAAACGQLAATRLTVDMSGYRSPAAAPARKRFVESPELVVRQLDLERADVLLEVAAALRPGDRDHVVAAGVHPGKRELRRRHALLFRERTQLVREARDCARGSLPGSAATLFADRPRRTRPRSGNSP